MQTLAWESGLTLSIIPIDAQFFALSIGDSLKGVVNQKLMVRAEESYKIHDFHGNPCSHSLDNLGWPSELHRSTQSLMLYRLVIDSRGVVGQKYGSLRKKLAKIPFLTEIFPGITFSMCPGSLFVVPKA